jgi:hypothetical protein
LFETLGAAETSYVTETSYAEEAEAFTADAAADAEAAADVARTAVKLGVLLIVVLPFIQLNGSDGADLLGFSASLEALICGAVAAQLFVRAQRRRAHRVEDAVHAAIAAHVPYAADTGFAALAARVSAAALGASSLAAVLYRSGHGAPWLLIGAACVFWLSARLLERGHTAGFPLALMVCVALFVVPALLERLGQHTDQADPGLLGTVALAAVLGLWRGRRRDEWEAHLERLRRADERELVPGQEPGGPQDAVPPEYVRAAARRYELLRARRAGRRADPFPFLVADLIVLLVGYRFMRAIGSQTGALIPDSSIGREALETQLLGGAVVLVLAVLAVIARLRGRGGLAAVHVVLAVCVAVGSALLAASHPS